MTGLTLTAEMLAERYATTVAIIQQRAALTAEMIERIAALTVQPEDDFWTAAGKQFSPGEDPQQCALHIVMWDLVKERDAKALR